MAVFEAGMEAMVDMYIFETTSLLEQLDQTLIKTESDKNFGEEEINEIFRVMHTIKGSSSMMGLENMARIAHIIEDMFFIIREDKPVIGSVESLYELIFTASDLMKSEIELVQEEDHVLTDFSDCCNKMSAFAEALKNGGTAAPAAEASASAEAPAPAAKAGGDGEDHLTTVRIHFEDDCKMENLRALLVVSKITEDCSHLEYIPSDIENNSDASKDIIENGFFVRFAPASDTNADNVLSIIAETANVKSYEIIDMAGESFSTSAPSSGDAVMVKVTFDDDCKMENLRALLVVNNIKDYCKELSFEPSDIESNANSASVIVENGFLVRFTSTMPEEVIKMIETTPNVKAYQFVGESVEAELEAVVPVAAAVPAVTVSAAPAVKEAPKPQPPAVKSAEPALPAESRSLDQLNNMLNTKGGAKQSLISVNLNKLDTLQDLVGEIVITEAMVTSNPDLKGLRLDNFQKAARQLRKLNSELQDTVMSIRMVPLSGAFNKMTRIVRDMKVKLGKDVDLVFEGEDTEVDKSIIDQLNDPLMHMVRNCMDHGIESSSEERVLAGKNPKGKLTLSAYNASGEVIIVVADDGGGINPQKVLEKAERAGILNRPPDEYTEKEVFNMIMLPGFSTNEEVTEFSGRGVGMDVVRKNIEKIGGTVSVDSRLGAGSSFTIKIPLSLSIVDGMEVSVGDSIFTIPINSIRESFKVKANQLVKDTSGREMIMIRGECFPLIRLYELYDLNPNTQDLYEGIVILVEAERRCACIFADELIGEQQVVVKPFSPLLNNYNIKANGMAGCSILGDGSITIILDVNNIITDF
ncbi:MAG: chemotaxis protein CheA [Oscillospiraceae bacterium]|nr:chemotaxis protein CheA [Oscillospiraceae bacterium]